jgi:SAM-dependent methyltransferase
MEPLMRAAFRISRLRDEGASRIAIAVDAKTDVQASWVAHVLEPWQTWLHITSLEVSDDPPGEDWIARPTDAVAVVTERPEFRDAVADACAKRGLRFLSSDYFAAGEPDEAFFHEVSHHQYVLGGLNEYTGEPALHAAHVLQHISEVNSIQVFPRYMIPELQTRFATEGRPLEAIDVGCGSISRLRWGAVQGLLHLTGVDPLLDFYEISLRYHGLDAMPKMKVDRAISRPGEQIGRNLQSASFDFAYCCNALDHVEDPPTVVSELAEAMRPGACFALEFATREGTRQEWRQLHQFDLFLADSKDEVLCQWRDGRTAPLVSKGTPLVLDRVIAADEVNTIVVLRRVAVAPGRTGRRGFTERLRARS